MPGSRRGSSRDWDRWLGLWTLLGVPGAALGTVMWGWHSVVPATIFPVLVCTAAAAVAHDMSTNSSVPGPMFRASWRAGVAGAVIPVALVAVGTISTSVALLVIVLMVVSSPPVLRWRDSLRDAGTAQTASAPSYPHVLLPDLLAMPLASMSDLGVCRAWQQSLLLLEEARSPKVVADVVRLRQSYLDELERRNAGGLQAWLSSGPRTAGSPESYLTGHAETPDAG